MSVCKHYEEKGSLKDLKELRPTRSIIYKKSVDRFCHHPNYQKAFGRDEIVNINCEGDYPSKCLLPDGYRD